MCDVRWPSPHEKSRRQRQTRHAVRVQEEVMKTRTLGNSGIEVSALGTAAWAWKASTVRRPNDWKASTSFARRSIKASRSSTPRGREWRQRSAHMAPPVMAVRISPSHGGGHAVYRHSELGSTEPPTFVAVSDRDGIASPATMENRAAGLRRLGGDVMYRKYPGVGHGFGLGVDTSAEGWIGDAVGFWAEQIKDVAQADKAAVPVGGPR
jgi:acetyl esterase/lipase